ncbi:MAG: hypothetical protein QM597_05115 [Aeromicrobium sp.]|uniref:hypothetical protein n=1 Tax=Aeromicrobium sp. TaxID=1871063 RepID=UPI0039E401BE
MKPATRAPGRHAGLDLHRSGPWIAAVGLLAVLWLVVMAGFLFAPWWGVAVHLVVLGCFATLLARRGRVAPAATVWIPLYAFGAWVTVNAAGVLAFGWRM